MKTKKLVIFGAGNYASLVKVNFEADSPYEVCGYVIDREYISGETFCGLPLVASDEAEKIFPPDEYEMYIALGYTSLNEFRKQKYFEYKARGYTLATYISSKAICWYAGNEFGDNVFIYEGVMIGPYACIGANTILSTGCMISDYDMIGNHVYVARNATLACHVTVGDGSFIGINSTVLNGLCIGENNIISAGSMITKNTKPCSIYQAESTTRCRENVSIEHLRAVMDMNINRAKENIKNTYAQ